MVNVIVNPLILLMFGVATAYFIFNFVRFLSLEPGDKNREESRKAIMWGIIGMVVMFSVYGLIRFTLNTFGIDANDINSAGAKKYLGL